jgi:FkbM family methyltransferase
MKLSFQGVASRFASAVGSDSPVLRRLRPWYEQILWLQSRGRGIEWSLNQVPCRIDPRQRHRMWRDYDEAVASWLGSRVKPGDSCVIVGANIGVYPLECAHWSRPDGTIVAFEPNPHAREILRRHLRFNQLESRVQIVDAAVAAREGESTFFADRTGDGMSRLGEPNPLLHDVAELKVRTVTLDSFLTSAPDWMVIDTEGFEIAVLRGGRRIVQACKATVVELHPSAWPVAGTTREDLESLLDELSLTLTPLSGQSDPLSHWGHVALQRSDIDG